MHINLYEIETAQCGKCKKCKNILVLQLFLTELSNSVEEIKLLS